MAISDLSVPAANAIENAQKLARPLAEWFRKTVEPTQELTRTWTATARTRLVAFVAQLRTTLGFPDADLIAEVSRRLARIESKLEGFGGGGGGKEPKEKKN